MASQRQAVATLLTKVSIAFSFKVFFCSCNSDVNLKKNPQPLILNVTTMGTGRTIFRCDECLLVTKKSYKELQCICHFKGQQVMPQDQLMHQS